MMDFLLTLLVLIGIIDASLLGVLLLAVVVGLNRLGQTAGDATATTATK